MALPAAVLDAFAIQAAACAGMEAPFTARLCRLIPLALDPATATGQAVADWPLPPVASALALRLCGALHRLVRAGAAPGLAALYPPAQAGDGALLAGLRTVLTERDAGIRAAIDHPPQTNEIGRSAVLIGALMQVAAETGVPLELWEIGASAGLNLMPDAWAYDLGEGRRWGPRDAPVTISCRWRGAAPALRRVTIAARAGCDIAPLDPRLAEDRDRLLGYIWPEQPGRLARTAAALEHAARAGAAPVRAEAADWLADRLARPAVERQARVLMHSVMWQYMPAGSQARITSAIAAAGAAATRRTPLAWVRMEPDATPGSAALRLTLWPGGADRLLARCHFHGAWADWAG